MRPPKPFSHYVIPVPEAGCHLWAGAWHHRGYGFTGNHRQAHRVAYEDAHGPIPDGMVVRHKCDTPACVNPEHLLLGTSAQNVQDRVKRNRGARGEKGGSSKLTEMKVREIRDIGRSESQQVIADRYGVSQGAISRIILGKNWGWLQ